MKKISIVLILLAVSVSVLAVRTEALRLIQRMAKLQRKGIMIGHQDDPVYGCSWKWEEGRSDVKEVCGDYPAVMGFDLGEIEKGKENNLDGVPFKRMRQEIIRQYDRGGIVTLSWHPNNPATGKNAWDATGDAVTQILPGARLHTQFNGWLLKVCSFIRSLKTKAGKPIPVIFRPWHEMSGGWFWWGEGHCTVSQYKQLYRYTVNFMKRHHCDNIVWAYSPNLADEKETVAHYEKYYPGDDVVDLLGIDIYQREPDNAQYQQWLHDELSVVASVGEKHKKLIALTETGYNNVPDSTWFTKCLLPVLKQYPLCYVLFWRNAWDNPTENYIAAPGKASESDFREFYQDSSTLFARDVK